LQQIFQEHLRSSSNYCWLFRRDLYICGRNCKKTIAIKALFLFLEQ